MADYIFAYSESSQEKKTKDEDGESNTDKLNVFGYSCKLFRDDQKAESVNSGALLVPWFNDKTLMIDRFDCRGYLMDLVGHDGETIQQTSSLTAHDFAMDQACDEERYRDLHSDSAEMALLEEEEQKRASVESRSKFGEVGFTYEVDHSKDDQKENNDTNSDKTETQNTTESEKKEVEEDNEPYEPPPELSIPPDYVLPGTMKQAAIIDRTAIFIARQGIQMEIVVKTKQADNPHFSFLHYGDVLNPFYRWIVGIIKSGRYTPRPRQPKNNAPVEEPYKNKSIHEDHYELKLPKVDISNTSYAKLINRFKVSSQRKTAAISENNVGSGTSTPILQPIDEISGPDIANGTQEAETSGVASPTQSNSSSVQDGNSNLDDASTSTDIAKQGTGHTVDYERLYSDYYQHYYTYYYNYYVTTPPSTTTSYTPAQLTTHASHAAAHAAHTAVETARKEAAKKTQPPADVRTLIDRMADYVARNGPEFELVVAAKKDQRFGFLETNHVWHNYYMKRRRELELANAKIQATKVMEAKRKLAGESIVLTHSSSSPNLVGGTDGYDDDDEGDQGMQSSRSNISFSLKGKVSSSAETPPQNTSGSVAFYLDEDTGEEDTITDIQVDAQREEHQVIEGMIEGITDPSVMEQSSEVSNNEDLTGPTLEEQAASAEESERRLNQNRLRDQLASAAREKLAQVRRESDIQAERKRKAAAFMARLKEEQRLQQEKERIEQEREAEARKRSAQELARKRDRTPPAAYALPRKSRSRSRSPRSTHRYHRSTTAASSMSRRGSNTSVASSNSRR